MWSLCGPDLILGALLVFRVDELASEHTELLTHQKTEFHLDSVCCEQLFNWFITSESIWRKMFQVQLLGGGGRNVQTSVKVVKPQ